MAGASRRMVTALALGGLLAAAGPARADIVELTNGVRIEGTVIKAEQDGLRVRVGEREVWIPQDRVRSVTFGSAPAGAAKEAPRAPMPPATGAAPAPTPPATGSAPAPAPAAVPEPAPMRPVLPQIAQALAALDRLQIATGRRLSAADYTARVAETRQEVERALDGLTGEDDVRRALDAALQYHAVAAHAESVFAERGDLGTIRLDPRALTDCRPLGDLITRDAAQLKLDRESPAVVGLLLATEGAQVLRECAGEKVAEAESLARAPRPAPR